MKPSTRTIGLAVCGFLGLTAASRAQETWAVLKPDSAAAPPRHMLYAYLQAQAKKHFDARRAAVAALKTPQDVRRRQHELRTKFIEALGGFPERTPLHPRVVGKEPRDGYRVERVVYESRPQHHVTAVLYLPDGAPPFPGVLVPCGHSANGKAAEPYQRVCISMAKHGLAVLCYDPIGQGERLQLLTADGKPAVPASTAEHTLAGVGALLVGQNTATYRIWDGIRSLDYLAGRPEVDPRRLGCTGNSGGGTLTAYLMALDDRIAAAAPSCYLTSLERLFATIGPQDAEQNITGQVAFGLEHADYVTLRAPKPTLMCVGTQDYFDIHGAWATFREAKLLYGLLGHGARVDLFEYNDKHGFSKPRREAAMHWMRRWLLGRDDTPAEGNFSVLKDEQLQCTRTGQILSEFHGRSVFDLNAAQERGLAPRRNQFQDEHGPDAIRKAIRRLIALPDTVPPAQRQVVSRSRQGDILVSKILYTPEPGITLPALHFQPGRPVPDGRPAPTIFYVHGAGKAADVPRLTALAAAGHEVLALDLRGLGETASGAKRQGYGTDEQEAFLALHLNRPLLGQRVFDLLAVVRSCPKDADLQVIGVGSAGPVVLHAAALEPAIQRVTVEQSVISWSAVVQTPLGRNQLTNVVPGALKVYDLPDLAALIAPRALTVRAAVDPARRPLSDAGLEEAYARARAAYARQGAEKKLLLQSR
jgi:cephalosporin-C deacetylase-like acetyl esterase